MLYSVDFLLRSTFCRGAGFWGTPIFIIIRFTWFSVTVWCRFFDAYFKPIQCNFLQLIFGVICFYIIFLQIYVWREPKGGFLDGCNFEMCETQKYLYHRPIWSSSAKIIKYSIFIVCMYQFSWSSWVVKQSENKMSLSEESHMYPAFLENVRVLW